MFNFLWLNETKSCSLKNNIPILVKWIKILLNMSHYLSYEPYQLNGIIEFIGKHSKEPCVQTSGVTGSIVIPWINWILEYENGFNRIYKVSLCIRKKIQLSILLQIHARPKPFMAYQRVLQYQCRCLHCHVPNVISVSNYLQSILFVFLKLHISRLIFKFKYIFKYI